MRLLITNYRKTFLVLGLTTLLIIFSLPTTLAGEVRSNNIVHIKSDEVIDDDLIAMGSKVIVDGTVKGDVMAAGQSVIVNGTVEGDVMASAQAVTVNGEVTDDLRVGAMTILINGTVGDDVLVGGFSFESGPESNIGGDLLMGGFQALVDGELDGDIKGGLGGLKISGQVGGDVDVEVDTARPGPSPVAFMGGIPNVPPMPRVSMGLTVDEGASIAGDVTYHSPAEAQVNEAAVAGDVRFVPQEAETSDQPGFGSWLWDEIQRLLRLLLVGALAIWLAPVFVGEAGQKLRERLWPSLGWGALTPIIFLVVLLVLGLVSFLVGFPILVFGTLIFGYLLVLFYLGAIVVGQCLGRLLLQRIRPDRAESILWSTLVGLVGVWLLTIIPLLGAIVGFFVMLFGVGGLWLAGRDRMKGIDGEAAVVI
jgi:hypothetical protein